MQQLIVSSFVETTIPPPQPQPERAARREPRDVSRESHNSSERAASDLGKGMTVIDDGEWRGI
jgi:hypothetical protein